MQYNDCNCKANIIPHIYDGSPAHKFSISKRLYTHEHMHTSFYSFTQHIARIRLHLACSRWYKYLSCKNEFFSSLNLHDAL